MNNYFNCLSLMLLLTFSMGCSNGSSSKATPLSSEKTTTQAAASIALTQHDSKSYSISYPQSWKLYPVNQYAELVSIIDEKSSRSFKRNFSVQISEKEEITLDALVEKFTKQVTEFQKDAVIESSMRLQRNGIDYHKLVYISEQANIKNINCHYVHSGKGFFLSYTTLIEDFASEQEMAMSVLDSFVPK